MCIRDRVITAPLGAELLSGALAGSFRELSGADELPLVSLPLQAVSCTHASVTAIAAKNFFVLFMIFSFLTLC